MLRFLSISTLGTSRITFTISNRDKIGSERFTLSAKLRELLYLPWRGLAAAITLHLALSWATIPALEMEIVCCYIASWIDVLSWSFILSNSSIKHIPRSACTIAPASSLHYPVWWSCLTLAVRPTAEAPWPVA